MSRCYSRLAQVGLISIVLALLLDCVALTLDIVLGRRIVAGQEIQEASLDRSSQLSSAANLAVPAAVLLGGLIFVWWFHCAYRRRDAMHTTNYASMWAAISWFIPGINLVRPPKIMIELAARPVLTWSWWVLWGLGAVIQFVLRLISPGTQQGWVYWQMTAFAANLLLLAALVAAIMLVATVSEVARARGRYWREETASPNQRPKLAVQSATDSEWLPAKPTQPTAAPQVPNQPPPGQGPSAQAFSSLAPSAQSQAQSAQTAGGQGLHLPLMPIPRAPVHEVKAPGPQGFSARRNPVRHPKPGPTE
ncbi:MAG: DUF4328 domain-containing protein [Acidimicrobiales bacterium]